MTRLSGVWPDVVAGLGALIVVLGVGMIYRPAAVMLAGLVLLGVGILGAKPQAKEPRP